MLVFRKNLRTGWHPEVCLRTCKNLWWSFSAKTVNEKMCKSCCVLGCIVEKKRYEHGSLFITDNCLNMCSCQHRNGREILACLPLCPPLSRPKCGAGEEIATITSMFSWRPTCYCQSNICWTKSLSSREFLKKIEPELWHQKRSKNGIK